MELSKQDVVSHVVAFGLGVLLGYQIKKWRIKYLEMREEMLKQKLEKIQKAKEQAKSSWWTKVWNWQLI